MSRSAIKGYKDSFEWQNEGRNLDDYVLSVPPSFMILPRGETGFTFKAPTGLVSGYGFYSEGLLGLTRCPVCERENYSMSVTAGTCAWCGFNAHEMPSTADEWAAQAMWIRDGVLCSLNDALEMEDSHLWMWSEENEPPSHFTDSDTELLMQRRIRLLAQVEETLKKFLGEDPMF